MNDEQRDPLDRLRAADPAADLEPNAGFAEEVVARAAADEGAAAQGAVDAGAVTTGPTGGDAAVTDLRAVRARRSRRWLRVAAVAASLAVVGGGGYAVGASTGGPTNLAGGPMPAISLQGGPQGGAGMAPMPAPGNLKLATPGDLMTTPGASGMIAPYGGGRNEFSASGLSDADGTARAYAFDARAASDTKTVARLATALGVEGTPELKDGAWVVGPQNGTAPSLWVSLDGTLSFSYSDPRNNPWQCADAATACVSAAGDLPGEQAAIDALRSLLAAAGRDPAGYEFTSETWDGAVTRSAQAWRVVDGHRTDHAWSVELAESGLVSASGALADLVPIGEYPIVSAQQAFERLSDPRFGAQFTAMPAATRGAPVTTDVWTPPTEPPAAPTAGTSLAWPVHHVEIVEARLGLASQWQPDGSVLVVPAYSFTDADGGRWSMIAVADAKLDFAVG